MAGAAIMPIRRIPLEGHPFGTIIITIKNHNQKIPAQLCRLPTNHPNSITLQKLLMKAVIIQQYGGPEHLRIGEWPKPRPPEGGILVKVEATALNRADILQRMGRYPPPEGESPILGLEMAGTVAGVGPGVYSWKPGDAVCGLLAGGGYAEYAVIHQEMALPVPEGMSFEQAAAIPEVFLTAFQALVWLGKLQKDERILIHAGASGVGTAALQLAAVIGAESIATASAGKHDICRSLGASLAVDYRSEDFEKAVKDYTGGQGVDMILDFIGAPYLQRNLNLLRQDGRLVMLALMGGVQVDALHIGAILRKRLQIKGSTLRNRPLDYKIALTKAFREFAWELFHTGKLRPVIDRVFDWSEAEEAHRYMEGNRNKGKVVLRVGEGIGN
jgi:tumor protein p53-inducible protein 3